MLKAVTAKITAAFFVASALALAACGGTAVTLHQAAEDNATETAAQLLEDGADVNEEEEDDLTPLHVAARHNAAETAALLLENGADVNAEARDDLTPLHIAAVFDAAETAALLLENGAGVHAKTKYDWTLSRWGREPIAIIASAPKAFAYTAVMAGLGFDKAEASMQEFRENALRSIAEKEDNLTPLHMAAQHGALDTAALLLENGAEVHAKSRSGFTPLHMVRDGNLDTAALLLENGAEVNAKTKDDSTPLHIAAVINAPETAALLLENGAEVNVKNGDGQTPLDFAIIAEAAEMQSLLKRHGGQCNNKC